MKETTPKKAADFSAETIWVRKEKDKTEQKKYQPRMLYPKQSHSLEMREQEGQLHWKQENLPPPDLSYVNH